MPTSSNTPLTDSTILLSMRSFFHLCVFTTSPTTIKPKPPATISSASTTSTNALPENSETLSPPEIMSSPALQNADTLWKIPYHSAVPNEYSNANAAVNRITPAPSIIAVIFTTLTARLLKPLMSVPLRYSRMFSRSLSVNLCPMSTNVAEASVIKPIPPICTSSNTTTCPNGVRAADNSIVVSPVTHVALVAVNSASR